MAALSGEAEVADLDPSVASQVHTSKREVAVDQPVPVVQRVQSFHDLRGETQSPVVLLSHTFLGLS